MERESYQIKFTPKKGLIFSKLEVTVTDSMGEKHWEKNYAPTIDGNLAMIQDLTTHFATDHIPKKVQLDIPLRDAVDALLDSRVEMILRNFLTMYNNSEICTPQDTRKKYG